MDKIILVLQFQLFRENVNMVIAKKIKVICGRILGSYIQGSNYIFKTVQPFFPTRCSR